MSAHVNQLTLIAMMAAVIALSIGICALVAWRSWRPCGAAEAIVRTGSSPEPLVVIGRGVMVFPLLHAAQSVALGAVTAAIARTGREGVYTRDGFKVDVRVVFTFRVEPTREGVLAAQRCLADRSITAERLGPLFDARFGALGCEVVRHAVAQFELLQIHRERERFTDRVCADLGGPLRSEGLLIGHVVLARLGIVPLELLDPHHVLDATAALKIDELAGRDPVTLSRGQVVEAIAGLAQLRADLERPARSEAPSVTEAERLRAHFADLERLIG